MEYLGVFVYECLSFMSAQDLGSNVDLASDHGFVCCNPVLETVNLGDLGEMVVGAGLEICCTAVVEARILEFVQCSNLALCCGKAYLLLCCGILPMSGFISGVPFILTFLPYHIKGHGSRPINHKGDCQMLKKNPQLQKQAKKMIDNLSPRTCWKHLNKHRNK
jgi:hypothetical protein